MISLNQKLFKRSKDIKSVLCIGLDINPENLESNSLDDLIIHSKMVVDATKDLALAFKPNFAFFERWGSKGFSWLEELIDHIGDGPILIADAKRGDIGNTARQYADSIFKHFGFDCVTLNPYMGRDSIYPFLDIQGKGVFILCRTSNNSGNEFQNQMLNTGNYLYEEVAKWAKNINKNDNVGLVVGATVPEELARVREIVPDLPLLIPGVGTQGGDLEKSVMDGNSSGLGIINISRAISFAGDRSFDDIRSMAKSYFKKISSIL